MWTSLCLINVALLSPSIPLISWAKCFCQHNSLTMRKNENEYLTSLFKTKPKPFTFFGLFASYHTEIISWPELRRLGKQPHFVSVRKNKIQWMALLIKQDKCWTIHSSVITYGSWFKWQYKPQRFKFCSFFNVFLYQIQEKSAKTFCFDKGLTWSTFTLEFFSGRNWV